MAGLLLLHIVAPITNWSPAAECSNKMKEDMISHPVRTLNGMSDLSLYLPLLRATSPCPMIKNAHTENSELFGVMNVFYQDHWGQSNFLKFLELNLLFRSLTNLWIIQTSYNIQHPRLNMVQQTFWSLSLYTCDPSLLVNLDFRQHHKFKSFKYVIKTSSSSVLSLAFLNTKLHYS